MSIKNIVIFCGLSFVSLVLCGCPGQSVDTSDFESATNSAESSDQRKTERLFDNAIEALNRLEQDSSGESGDRVTGRLNEWIKTTPELKDWAPDPMTPDWQKNVQKNLPFIAQVAQQVQFARQDISLTIDKCVRLFQLQKELNALIQNQQAGAPDQKTLDKIEKTINGNGNPGLVEKVARLQERLDGTWKTLLIIGWLANFAIAAGALAAAVLLK